MPVIEHRSSSATAHFAHARQWCCHLLSGLGASYALIPWRCSDRTDRCAEASLSIEASVVRSSPHDTTHAQASTSPSLPTTPNDREVLAFLSVPNNLTWSLHRGVSLDSQAEPVQGKRTISAGFATIVLVVSCFLLRPAFARADTITTFNVSGTDVPLVDYLSGTSLFGTLTA